MTPTRPTVVRLNTQSANLIQRLVGIDHYPMILMMMPPFFDLAERDRADITMMSQLRKAGIVVANDEVHPSVMHWVKCLGRPEVELTIEVIDTKVNLRDPLSTLRGSFVRAGETYVLALRHGYNVVFQQVNGTRPSSQAAAAVRTMLGEPNKPLQFEPFGLASKQLEELPVKSPEEVRRSFVRMGASHRTAHALTLVKTQSRRWVGMMMNEYHDGGSTQTQGWAGVFDTPEGRAVLIPQKNVDGATWCTYYPGTDQSIEHAIRALVSLLPSASWTAGVRT